MALESITYINSLNVLNPGATDFLSEGDDHIRGIKQAIKSTFPSVTGPVTATHTELNRLAGVGTSTLKTTGTAGEWVQMVSANISGTPVTIDFVNGTSGVTISDAYDAYEIELIDVTPNVSGQLQLLFASGSGFPNNATGCVAQVDWFNFGSASSAYNVDLPHITITDTTAGNVTGIANALTARIIIYRPTGSLNAPVMAQWEHTAGRVNGTCRGSANAGTSQFTSLRVTFGGVKTFNTHGSYRFRARKA